MAIFYICFKSCFGKLNLCFIVITKSFGLCSNPVLDHNFLNSVALASYFFIVLIHVNIYQRSQNNVLM